MVVYHSKLRNVRFRSLRNLDVSLCISPNFIFTKAYTTEETQHSWYILLENFKNSLIIHKEIKQSHQMNMSRTCTFKNRIRGCNISASSNYYDCSHIEYHFWRRSMNSRDVFYRVLKRHSRSFINLKQFIIMLMSLHLMLCLTYPKISPKLLPAAKVQNMYNTWYEQVFKKVVATFKRNMLYR